MVKNLYLTHLLMREYDWTTELIQADGAKEAAEIILRAHHGDVRIDRNSKIQVAEMDLMPFKSYSAIVATNAEEWFEVKDLINL